MRMSIIRMLLILASIFFSAGTTLAASNVIRWGVNTEGFPVLLSTPEPISQVSSHGISGATPHFLAVSTSGNLLGFGDNTNGVLGLPTSTSVYNVVTNIPGQTNIKAVATGSSFTIVLRNDNTVIVFGDDFWGTRGDGPDNNSGPSPTSVILSNVVAIDAGHNHALALKADGTVWAWGSGSQGELGQGSTPDLTVPTQVPGLPNNITAIGAGHTFSLAVTNDGKVFFWGQFGQAFPFGPPELSPVEVAGISTANSVAGGAGHALALLDDGTVVGWGKNNFGQLGVSTASTLIPFSIPNLSGIQKVVAGDRSSIVLTTGGIVLASGINEVGQLGVGPLGPSSRPSFEIVEKVSGVADIDMGFNLVVATGSLADAEDPIPVPPVPPEILTVADASGAIGHDFFHYVLITGTLPITIIVEELPPGLQLSGGAITGTPTQIGTYKTKISARQSINGFAFEAIFIITIVIVDNVPPHFVSGPTLGSGSLFPGLPAMFSVIVTDPDGPTRTDLTNNPTKNPQTVTIWGNSVTVVWDFGDGTTGTGTSPIHVYELPGSYVVTVTVSDGIASTTSLMTVNVAAIENAAIVRRVIAKVKFQKTGSDMVKVMGRLSPLAEGFESSGKSVELNVGGASEQFILDSKGKATASTGTFTLRLIRGQWVFKGLVRKGDFASLWAPLGMTNVNVRDVTIGMPVIITVAGVPYVGVKAIVYRAKAGRVGLAK